MEWLTITPVRAVSRREGLHKCEPCSYKAMQALEHFYIMENFGSLKGRKKRKKG